MRTRPPRSWAHARLPSHASASKAPLRGSHLVHASSRLHHREDDRRSSRRPAVLIPSACAMLVMRESVHEPLGRVGSAPRLHHAKWCARGRFCGPPLSLRYFHRDLHCEAFQLLSRVLPSPLSHPSLILAAACTLPLRGPCTHCIPRRALTESVAIVRAHGRSAGMLMAMEHVVAIGGSACGACDLSRRRAECTHGRAHV